MDINRDSLGHKDQEVLIRAIIMYMKKNVETPEGVLIGWLRMSIADCEKKYDKKLKEMKCLPEVERDSFLLDMLKNFFTKTGLDHKKRTSFKYDCLQIYERWKEMHRPHKEGMPREEEVPAAEKTVQQQKQAVEEENLLGEFDSLDLDEFDDLFK